MGVDRNTIIGKAYTNIRDEKDATNAITPGDLVERLSDGTVQKHSTAAGPVNPLFAIENAPEGNGLDDDYADGDLVQLWKPQSGEQVYARSDDTTAGAIVIGDFLESDGNGRVRGLTVGQSSAAVDEFANSIFAVALEAAAVDERFLIEII